MWNQEDAPFPHRTVERLAEEVHASRVRMRARLREAADVESEVDDVSAVRRLGRLHGDLTGEA